MANFETCRSIVNGVIATLIFAENEKDPQDSTRVSYAKEKNLNFRHFWQPSWILAGNEKE